MTNYLKIFSRTAEAATPQTHAIPNTVPNSADGYAFAVDDWARLDRFYAGPREGGGLRLSKEGLLF
jgi:60 kDa SS-A/Ro ribonucleoprotein